MRFFVKPASNGVSLAARSAFSLGVSGLLTGLE